jgi:hypothetical protein
MTAEYDRRVIATARYAEHAVEHGAQVDDLLHVAPAALDFEELLVAQGDVLGDHL